MKKDIIIKICGMREAENIRNVSDAVEPNLFGFIFYEKSPRYVSGQLPETKGIQRVGVFVDASLDQIIDRVEKFDLNYVQLHGDEPIELVSSLSSLGIGIIKVIRVKDSINYIELEPFVGIIDYFLFDSAGKNYGGNGTSFEWELLKDYPFEIPYLIGGGISPLNISELMNLELPGFIGVDVNSGFEISPGLKDVKLLEKNLR